MQKSHTHIILKSLSIKADFPVFLREIIALLLEISSLILAVHLSKCFSSFFLPVKSPGCPILSFKYIFIIFQFL
jgi:hypothetical protein